MRKQIIVLVDDDETCQFINMKVIELSGIQCEVHSFCDGAEALKMINERQKYPDAIFVDLNMPVMDGFQFIQFFKGIEYPNKENTKIVVLTSSESSSDKQKALSLGINDFIIKPLTEDHVARLFSGDAA